MKRATVSALFALTATASGLSSASAQFREGAPEATYRPGQPPVLSPAPAAGDPEGPASAAFQNRYIRAGRPRVMILWNKAFDDEVASRYREHTHTEQDGGTDQVATENVARTYYGAVARQDGHERSHQTTDTMQGVERTPTERASLLSEDRSWEIEAALTDELGAHGVSLVDRGMAMRKTAMGHDLGQTPNVQDVEARAAYHDADLIVEILQTWSADDPAGVMFKLSVKDLRNSRILASLVTSGQPPVHHMPFVAGPRGYERATPVPPSPGEVGRQIAQDVMTAMAERL